VEVERTSEAHRPAPADAAAEIAALKVQMERLTDETAELRTLVERLYRNLGAGK
jgi:hypothetical protein